MKRRSASAAALPQDRTAAQPRAPAQLPPPPAVLPARRAAGGLIFGGAYTASDPLGHSDPFESREVSRTAEAWGWCEWVRMSLLVAALAAACLSLAPQTIAQRAHAQVSSRPLPPSTSAPHLAPPAPDQNAGPAAIGAIHYWSDDDATTVTVNLPGVVFFEAHRLTGPDRVYFDLAGTEMPSDVQGRVIQVDVGQTFVRKIRVAQRKPGVTRVVLEITPGCDYSAMIAPDPYRLIVRLHAPK